MRRSKFSLSHYKLFSCGMGDLIPIACYEALPGDTIQQATSALIRCNALLAPVMHPTVVRIHSWFVPNRLVWSEWEDFITGGPNGTSVPTFPTISTPTPNGIPIGGLLDYYGIPTGVSSLQVSALPIRGYNLIYNEHYRDQDLSPEQPIALTSGPDTTTNTGMMKIAWEKDYFTSARPWEQKGPQVTVPISGTSTVISDGTTMSWRPIPSGAAAGTTQDASGFLKSAGFTGPAQYGGTGLSVNMSGANLNINALRQAFALQRFEEARARYGSRYVEYLRYLGVRSSDARLQRPEYLGGGKNTIQFSEIVQVGPGASSNVGELKGHGIGATRSNRYRRFIEEHGYIHTFMSIRPKSIYTQGLNRHWSKRIKEDFWQRELQHIGQQAVYNREIMLPHGTPTGIFGYQDRYDEYRRGESWVSGEFRTSSLNHWHMARTFATEPVLNNDFVQCLPTERIFASTSTDPLYVMANHSIQARRLVAKVGTSHIF